MNTSPNTSTNQPGFLMHMVRTRVGRSVVAGLLGASLLVGGVQAAGLIPGPDGVIHGCYQDNNGKLRVIAADETCERNETALPWNQAGVAGPKGDIGPKGDKGDAGPQGQPGAQGQTGPQGPAGPQGPQGQQGQQGQPGLSGYQVIPVQQPIGGAGAYVFDAACPGGEMAISGGYALPAGSTVTESHPRDGDPTVWRLAFAVPSATTLTLYLQCAHTS